MWERIFKWLLWTVVISLIPVSIPLMAECIFRDFNYSKGYLLEILFVSLLVSAKSLDDIGRVGLGNNNLVYFRGLFLILTIFVTIIYSLVFLGVEVGLQLNNLNWLFIFSSFVCGFLGIVVQMAVYKIEISRVGKVGA